MQMGKAAGVRPLAERRKFRRAHDRPGLIGGADMRRDDPERAAFEHARDVVRRVGGNAHERRDPASTAAMQIWPQVSSEKLECSRST
jgi:hypothetical protein